MNTEHDNEETYHNISSAYIDLDIKYDDDEIHLIEQEIKQVVHMLGGSRFYFSV